MKKILVASLACLGLLIGLNGIARANLITNGSFEDGTYSSNDPFITLNQGSTAITGWTVKSGSIDWINTYWNASDGSKSLDLAGYYQHGLISTTFNATVGQTYRVQFDMAGNPDQPYAKSLVSVSTGDLPPSSHIFTFDQGTNNKNNMGWETKYFDFVAQAPGANPGDSIAVTLMFGDVTGQLINGVPDLSLDPNESWGAALDNVRVDPVPEPSTFLLLGAGLAGVAGLRRKSRSQS